MLNFHKSCLISTTCLSLVLFGCGGGSSDSSSIAPETTQTVRLIAMNDFHGNIEIPAPTNGGSVVVKDASNPAGVTVNTGGASFMASLVKKLQSENPNNIFVGAGDLVYASPVTSTLFHQEPAIDALNQMQLSLSSVGNHEFDLGKTELLRLQNGGCFPGGTIGTDTCLNNGLFSGAKFQYLAANVTDSSNKTILPATSIKDFSGVKVGFIGLPLKDTPTAVLPAGVAGLSFLDEATTINSYAAQLRSNGANAVVVLIHQGGSTTATTINDKSCPNFSGDIVGIAKALSNDVDVIISGHTHQEYICTVNGKLLTSAGFYGSVLTSIDLTISNRSGVKSAVANNIPVVNDTNKTLPAGLVSLAKDGSMDSIVQNYVTKAAAVKNLTVGSITADIKRALLSGGGTPTRDETAEGAMGGVMADFMYAGVPKADFAITNPGGVRDDLIFSKANGVVTYGDLLTVAPFGNDLVTVDLTGAQIIRLLEQQWEALNCAAKNGPTTLNSCGRMLQVSSQLSYSWDFNQPQGAADGKGARVVVSTIRIGGAPIDLAKTYRIATVSFLGQGGDNFTVMQSGKNYVATGYKDIDAFVAYMKANPKLAPPSKRITRLN
jgi:5'-nucleotidase